MSTEDKVRNFVIRNSKNGFFTKLSTISTKFNITEDESLVIAGFLLNDNTLECARSHDGQMKLYQTGCLNKIKQEQRKRFAQKQNVSSAGQKKSGRHGAGQKQKPKPTKNDRS